MAKVSKLRKWRKSQTWKKWAWQKCGDSPSLWSVRCPDPTSCGRCRQKSAIFRAWDLSSLQTTRLATSPSPGLGEADRGKGGGCSWSRCHLACAACSCRHSTWGTTTSWGCRLRSVGGNRRILGGGGLGSIV